MGKLNKNSIKTILDKVSREVDTVNLEVSFVPNVKSLNNKVSKERVLGKRYLDIDGFAVLYNKESLAIMSETDIKFPENCSEMFQGIKLKSIDFNGVDTTNVYDMSEMFEESYIVKGIRFTRDFVTDRVTDFGWMFHKHIEDKNVVFDLSNFNTKSAKYMSGMFDTFSGMLKGKCLGDNFITENVTHMDMMFKECYFYDGFTLGDKFDTRNLESFKRVIDSCHIRGNVSLGDNFYTISNGKYLEPRYLSFIDEYEDYSIDIGKHFLIPSKEVINLNKILKVNCGIMAERISDRVQVENRGELSLVKIVDKV